MRYRPTLGKIVWCLVPSLFLLMSVVQAEEKVDPVGTWKLAVKSSSQSQRSSTIKISRDGDKLVGLYTGSRSGAVKASDVKLTGSQLSFTVASEAVVKGLMVVYVGTIKGDSITGSVEYRFGDRRGKRDFTGSRGSAKNVQGPTKEEPAKTVAGNAMHKDVRYSDEYERSVMDIWTVVSDKPAPLVVNFHGGGFKAGDKRGFARSPLIRKYYPQGVAFATVNYPFLKHTGNDYSKILEHTAEAIKFLQSNAKKYNIDANRISVMGSSAGALISCHLGHAKKLSVASVYAFQQPTGTPRLTVPRLRKDGPPIVIYNRSGTNDRVHHPDNAAAVHKRLQSLGVYSEVYGVKGSGLPEIPEGKNIHDIVMKVFYKSWKLPFPDEKVTQ